MSTKGVDFDWRGLVVGVVVLMALSAVPGMAQGFDPFSVGNAGATQGASGRIGSDFNWPWGGGSFPPNFPPRLPGFPSLPNFPDRPQYPRVFRSPWTGPVLPQLPTWPPAGWPPWVG